MRTPQKHVCWGCKKPVETFIKVKRKIYFVKKYQCDPVCFNCLDYERLLRKSLDILSKRSPWIDFLEGGNFNSGVSFTVREAK